MSDPHPAVVAVAKAAAKRMLFEAPWDKLSPEIRRACINSVLFDIRAFLDATREPSETMIELGSFRRDVSQAWHAMHDQLRREVLGDG